MACAPSRPAAPAGALATGPQHHFGSPVPARYKAGQPVKVSRPTEGPVCVLLPDSAAGRPPPVPAAGPGLASFTRRCPHALSTGWPFR